MKLHQAGYFCFFHANEFLDMLKRSWRLAVVFVELINTIKYKRILETL